MPTSSTNPRLPFGENKNAEWYGKDIISVKQFKRTDLEYVFGVAHEMRGRVERIGTFDLLKGKILANLFYEPSTRTWSSFTAAMERLGGSVIPISEVKYSSVSKGESLPDTIRTLECYADVIVLRHPETGSAAIAAKAAKKPVINKRFLPNWEVEKIVYVPLRELLNPESYACYRLHFKGAGKNGEEGYVQDFPCFRHQNEGDREVLWGATFRIVMSFLETVFGFSAPSMDSLPVITNTLNERYLNGSL